MAEIDPIRGPFVDGAAAAEGGAPRVAGQVDDTLRTTNYNVSDGRIRYEDNWTQARLEWQPSQGVRVRTGAQYLKADRHWRNLENYLIDPAAQTVFREFYLEILHDQKQYGSRTDAVIDRPLFGRPNTFSAGFDYTRVRFQHTNNSPYGGTSVVDLVDPEPGQFLNVAGTFPKYRTSTHRVAVFAEDRLEITPSLSLVGGFRVDRYDVDREELLREATAGGLYSPVSWRGGAVYAVRPDLSLYGQYSTATDVIGNTATRLALEPTVGRQIEAGVKVSFLDDRGQWTLAGYRIVKDNLLAPDPLNPGTSLQIGQQSSRGVEATLGPVCSRRAPNARLSERGGSRERRRAGVPAVEPGLRSGREVVSTALGLSRTTGADVNM